MPWNTKTKLNSYRPLQPMPGSKPEFIDLDNDGPKSIRQQYSFGYWLKFYLFMDMLEKAKTENNQSLASEIISTYFSRKK